MKIVVLDGYTVNPGDLSWSGLEKLGNPIIYDRTPYSDDEIVEAIDDATILLTNKTPLSRKVLEKVPSVKYIGLLATGYNVVDVVAAKELGITVTNVPSYGTTAVAQMTLALLLEMCHNAGHHSRAVKQGKWTKSKDFCFLGFSAHRIGGQNIGHHRFWENRSGNGKNGSSLRHGHSGIQQLKAARIGNKHMLICRFGRIAVKIGCYKFTLSFDQ